MRSSNPTPTHQLHPFAGRAWRDLARFVGEALAAGLITSFVLALATFIVSTHAAAAPGARDDAPRGGLLLRSAPDAPPVPAPLLATDVLRKSLEELRRVANPVTYMSSPGPKARRRGRVVARSVRDGRIRPRPVSPSRGRGGSVGRSTGCPAWARRCAGPGSGGGWRPVSDSEGAPGAWSERTCARGANRRVGCDTATGAVAAAGPLRSLQRLGTNDPS